MENENLNNPDQPKFFYVPTIRLIIVGIISLGIYEAYWMYKNWQYIKLRDRLDILPFWRAFFGIFYIHSLLNYISSDEEMSTVKPAEFPASVLATCWIIFIISSNILSRFDSVNLNILSLLIGSASVFFFVPVQNYINAVNASINPNSKYYDSMSVGHVLCYIFSLLFFYLIFYFITR